MFFILLCPQKIIFIQNSCLTLYILIGCKGCKKIIAVFLTIYCLSDALLSSTCLCLLLSFLLFPSSCLCSWRLLPLHVPCLLRFSLFFWFPHAVCLSSFILTTCPNHFNLFLLRVVVLILFTILLWFCHFLLCCFQSTYLLFNTHHSLPYVSIGL